MLNVENLQHKVCPLLNFKKDVCIAEILLDLFFAQI